MLPPIIRRVYPRASDNRLSITHPAVKVNRKSFFRAAALNFALLQLLFLGLFSYLFGSLFEQVSRTHAMEVLWVDYDGGVIGDAVRNAYGSLQSNSFPSLVERPVSDFPSPDNLRESVCGAKYWAALYTSPGASERLGRAVSGSASEHNASDVMFYIWNEARYPIVLDGVISGNLGLLSNTARASYATMNSSFALANMPSGDSDALLAYTNPWTLSSINIQTTIQGTRAVYNTICIVLILIQDFFYLANINGLYAQFKIYSKISPTRVIVTRDLISSTFTMIGSLLISGAIWAFKTDWDVSGKQFGLNWVILWLFAHVNFLAIDVFTIWIPPQYVPMALITWIVTNITSILIPFDLSSPFYRWGYALPAHAAYEVLTDNWSSGCNPHLHFALPILFAYEIIGLISTTIGVYRRCHLAVIAEEAGQEAMRLRVELAVKLEREQARHLSSGDVDRSKEDVSDGPSHSKVSCNGIPRATPKNGMVEAAKGDGASLDNGIEEADGDIVRIETLASQTGNLGPCFKVVGSASL